MLLNAKIAVKMRIEELCRERKLPINALAKKAKLTPSTVYSMLNEKSQNPGIVSIESVCNGFGISVREFFDSELFE